MGFQIPGMNPKTDQKAAIYEEQGGNQATSKINNVYGGDYKVYNTIRMAQLHNPPRKALVIFTCPFVTGRH
jgi:hypothetical protein